MDTHRPSSTALGVATRRAAHQLFDEPRVFEDPLAIQILGAEAEATLRAERTLHEQPAAKRLRALLVARSRYAEDAARAAFARGVTQCVVLGAGLDTFAYRLRTRAVRIFEVDHPNTQAHKRQLLDDAGIRVPSQLVFAPVDFERDTLAAGLAAAGFDLNAPVFVSWLGVVPYLTEAAVFDVARFIAERPSGTELVFDFGVIAERLTAEERSAREKLIARVAAAGEPFVTFFDPPVLAQALLALGFQTADVIGATTLNARYFDGRSDDLRVGGTGHLMHARV